MKLRNIILAISLVFAAFSCSMEDDTVMNDVENGIEEATEMYTAINFGLTASEIATKTTTPKGQQVVDEEETKISSYDIFLLEEGKIIGIIRNNGQVSGKNEEGIILKDSEFVTKYKIGRKLMAYVVLNATEYDQSDISVDPFEDIKIGDSENSIEKTEITGHLTANSLVKVGKKEFIIDGEYPKSVSPKGIKSSKQIEVEVHHVSARLEFSKFTCILNDFSNDVNVRLVTAEFRNIQTKGYIGGSEYPSLYKDSKKVVDKAVTQSEIDPDLTAYSYRNDTFNDHVELYVEFEVTDGGKTKNFSKTYTINPDGFVKGNYLYNIEVKWTITPDWSDSSIEFYTKDWVYEMLDPVEI